MLRRLPPIALAGIVTAVVLGLVIAVVIATGNAASRSVAPCTAALEAGPYGCVVFVSIDGADGDTAATEPAGGAITYRIERHDGQDRLIWTGDCNGGEGNVAVTSNRYRLDDLLMGQKACEGGAPVDRWAAGLFSGTVQVDDRDDGTVLLVHGDRSARFTQVVAARG